MFLNTLTRPALIWNMGPICYPQCLRGLADVGGQPLQAHDGEDHLHKILRKIVEASWFPALAPFGCFFFVRSCPRQHGSPRDPTSNASSIARFCPQYDILQYAGISITYYDVIKSVRFLSDPVQWWIRLSTFLFCHLPSHCLRLCLSIYLSIYLPIYLPIYLSIYLSQPEHILRAETLSLYPSFLHHNLQPRQTRGNILPATCLPLAASQGDISLKP